MAILNLFSKRMRAERGEFPDVYQYDLFNENLKIKTIHIINDCFFDQDYLRSEYYGKIIDFLCKEYGLFELSKSKRSYYEHLFNYFLEEKNTEKALDVVELCFRVIDNIFRNDNRIRYLNIGNKLNEAIEELNDRFKEEGFGYKYESGIIVKISNEFTHNEIVKPVLKLLSNKLFKGAEVEFLSAHSHYRKSENKECITDCLKSFESTMKIICKNKKFNVNDNATAKELINRLFEEKYIPQYLQCNFTALQSVMESGIPTIRNKLSAHGQGDKNIDPDSNITEYMINLTASNILFLIKLM